VGGGGRDPPLDLLGVARWPPSATGGGRAPPPATPCFFLLLFFLFFFFFFEFEFEFFFKKNKYIYLIFNNFEIESYRVWAHGRCLNPLDGSDEKLSTIYAFKGSN
jgi:hypothetical protein